MNVSDLDFSARFPSLLQKRDSKVISVVLKKGISRWIHRFSSRRKFLNIRRERQSQIFGGYCQKITREEEPDLGTANFLRTAPAGAYLNKWDLAYTRTLRGETRQESGSVCQKNIVYTAWWEPEMVWNSKKQKKRISESFCFNSENSVKRKKNGRDESPVMICLKAFCFGELE